MQSHTEPAFGPGDLRPLAHAREHLEMLGYRLLAERYICTNGACDLIAELDRRLLFVDVTAGRLSLATETTPTSDSRRALRTAASCWLAANPRLDPVEVRFDLIRIWLDRNGELVGTEHWPDAC